MESDVKIVESILRLLDFIKKHLDNSLPLRKKIQRILLLHIPYVTGSGYQFLLECRIGLKQVKKIIKNKYS